MSFRVRFPASVVVSLAGIVLTTMGSFAQQGDSKIRVEVEKPAFDDLRSPDLSTGESKSWKPKDWLEIETRLKIDLAPLPASKTCDKIQIKWYVAVENPDKRGTYLLLTKDVEHVNLPVADPEGVYVSVYLSPSSVRRLTGSDRAGKNAVKFVGFEVLYNGTVVAKEAYGAKVDWWNTASEKISRSDTVPLLTKRETPFHMMWWDRFAELAPIDR